MYMYAPYDCLEDYWERKCYKDVETKFGHTKSNSKTVGQIKVPPWQFYIEYKRYLFIQELPLSNFDP